MSTTVSYKGSTIATVDNNTKTLNTQGKYLEADIILTDVSQSGGTVFPLFFTFSADKTQVNFTTSYDDAKAAGQNNARFVFVNEGDDANGRYTGIHTGWLFDGTTFTEGISFDLQDWDDGIYSVAWGYVNGVLTTRTRKSFPNGNLAIYQNGTNIDVDQYSTVSVNVSGSSNVVMGEFTTGVSGSGTGSVSVPYTGSGFPIAAMVFVKGGMANNTSTGQLDWYNSVQRYAVGQWTYHNALQAEDCYTGVTTAVYKNSTSNSQTYSRTSSNTTSVRTSSAATNQAATCVRMSADGKTLKWYVASTSYGLHPNTTYQYILIFSS